MGRNRSLRGQDERRGICRAALLFVLLALLVAGCGKSGQGAETDPEKGSDAELLNAGLAQELTLLEVYTVGPRRVEVRSAVARRLRARQQAYVDAITKALRGLGGRTEAEAAEIDLSEVADEADFLALAYELENAAYAAHLAAAPQLFTDAPRTVTAALAAAHAQHLVVLRGGLGAKPVAAIPEAFESGEEPPPAQPSETGAGKRPAQARR